MRSSGSRLRAGMFAAIALAGWGAGAPRAFAAPTPTKQQTDEAQAHYEAGKRFYRTADFEKAVDEWKQGYQLTGEAKFLFNIGQAYRQKKDYEKSIFFYKQYLAENPGSENRGLVEQYIDEMQKAVDSQGPTGAPGGGGGTASPPVGGGGGTAVAPGGGTASPPIGGISGSATGDGGAHATLPTIPPGTPTGQQPAGHDVAQLSHVHDNGYGGVAGPPVPPPIVVMAEPPHRNTSWQLDAGIAFELHDGTPGARVALQWNLAPWFGVHFGVRSFAFGGASATTTNGTTGGPIAAAGPGVNGTYTDEALGVRLGTTSGKVRFFGDVDLLNMEVTVTAGGFTASATKGGFGVRGGLLYALSHTLDLAASFSFWNTFESGNDALDAFELQVVWGF